jgi:hypothetical protein
MTARISRPIIDAFLNWLPLVPIATKKPVHLRVVDCYGPVQGSPGPPRDSL